MTAIMIRVPSTFYIVKIVKSRSEKDRKRTRKGLEKDWKRTGKGPEKDRKRTGKGPEKDRKMTEKGSKRTGKGILSEPPIHNGTVYIVI